MNSWYENPVFWYCAIALLVGLVALLLVYRLANLLSERTVLGNWQPWPELVQRLLDYYQNIGFRANFSRHLVDSNRDFLQRRNEFWTIYLQVVVAVLIVVVLTLLLLTKTITAEAGLPILSAVAGFAISKSTSSNNSSGTDGDRERQA